MVVTASGHKSCVGAHSLHQFKSQHATVERERPFQIGDLQVNVADANLLINRFVCHQQSFAVSSDASTAFTFRLLLVRLVAIMGASPQMRAVMRSAAVI